MVASHIKWWGAELSPSGPDSMISTLNNIDQFSCNRQRKRGRAVDMIPAFKEAEVIKWG